MELSDELKNTIEHCQEYATDLLVETGESYPFGAFIDTIGNVHPMEMEIDKKNIPTIGTVISKLREFAEGEMSENKMRGYALCYEVSFQLTETDALQDAIAIDIKHSEEELPLFYVPFTKADEMVVGELFAVERS